MLSYTDVKHFISDYFHYLKEREIELRSFININKVEYLQTEEFKLFSVERSKNVSMSVLQAEWTEAVRVELAQIPLKRDSVRVLDETGAWVFSEAATAGVFFKDFIVRQFRKRNKGIVFIQTLVNIGLPSVDGYYNSTQIQSMLDRFGVIVSVNSYFRNRKLVIFCLEKNHWHVILPVELLELPVVESVRTSIGNHFYRGYVGVDASPNCVAVAVLNGSSVKIHVWCKKKQTEQWYSTSSNFELYFYQIIDQKTLFSDLCKFFTCEIKGNNYNCAIEGPLLPGKYIDSRQTKFVVDLREFIQQNSGVSLFTVVPWRLRQYWLSVVTSRSRWDPNRQGYLIYGLSLRDFSKKVAKIQNYHTYAFLADKEMNFLQKFGIDDTNFTSGSQNINNRARDIETAKERIKARYLEVGIHPVSDIVDSISVAYYMMKMDQVGSANRARPNCEY